MSDINIQLTAGQRFVLPKAYESDNVTITGPASSVVINSGTYSMKADDSLTLDGPELWGHGTISMQSALESDGVTWGDPHVQLGAVGYGETVHFIGDFAGALQLDKPMQFHGLLSGEEDYLNPSKASVSQSPAPGDVAVSNAVILMPGLTLGHAFFEDGVLAVYTAQWQPEAHLRTTGFSQVALVTNGGNGTGALPAGVAIVPSLPPGDNPLFMTIYGTAGHSG